MSFAGWNAQWNSPARMAGVAIRVEALQGSGRYHLEAAIIGTTEKLAREVVLNRPVGFEMECNFFGDCTYRYTH